MRFPGPPVLSRIRSSIVYLSQLSEYIFLILFMLIMDKQLGSLSAKTLSATSAIVKIKQLYLY